MKTLHLIRHAKSSWDHPGLADIDRPLNERGKKSCRVMADAIADAGCDFDNVYCSPAVRAQATIAGLSKALSLGEIDWQVEDDLYTFHAEDLMSWCRNLEEGLTSVVVVGHNPALTEFCNRLSGADIDNIPTCGYVQLAIDIDDWLELATDAAELVTFISPKMLS